MLSSAFSEQPAFVCSLPYHKLPKHQLRTIVSLQNYFRQMLQQSLKIRVFNAIPGHRVMPMPKRNSTFRNGKNILFIKKVGKLKEICETTTKEEMPPEKFLNKFPHKKLSDEQVSVLCNWVKTESQNLVKGLR